MSHQIVKLSLGVGRKLGKDRFLSLEVPLPGDKVVGPVDYYVPGTRIQGSLSAEANQGRAFHGTGDSGGLAWLNVDADLYQQVGVFIEFFFKIFKHGVSPFRDQNTVVCDFTTDTIIAPAFKKYKHFLKHWRVAGEGVSC